MSVSLVNLYTDSAIFDVLATRSSRSCFVPLTWKHYALLSSDYLHGSCASNTSVDVSISSPETWPRTIELFLLGGTSVVRSQDKAAKQ
jgi:hypothetical protein